MRTDLGKHTYRETFDGGPGGWLMWAGNFEGARPLALKDDVMTCRSPWWINYNHAPPHGGGYLHLLMYLNTRSPDTDVSHEYGGENRFVHGRYPLNFVAARFSVRLKGELELRAESQLCLLQGTHGGIRSGWVLTAQPFRVTLDWSEQTVTILPRHEQWTPLGTQPDRAESYGTLPLETVLFGRERQRAPGPVPAGRRADGAGGRRDRQAASWPRLPVWRSRLPEGYVLIDTIQIEFTK